MDIYNLSIYEALEITLVCMLTVFSILILITFIIYLFKFLPDISDSNIQVRQNKKNQKQATTNKHNSDFIDINNLSEDETAAVLAATIDFYETEKNEARLISIKKVG